VRYTQRLAEAGAVASVGSTGDSYVTNEIARRLTSGDSGDVRQLWVAEEASNEMRQAL
jgi:hypothetical protein